MLQDLRGLRQLTAAVSVRQSPKPLPPDPRKLVGYVRGFLALCRVRDRLERRRAKLVRELIRIRRQRRVAQLKRQKRQRKVAR